MEQNDMLSSLLSDPEKLQNALAMATNLLGGATDGGTATPPPETPLASSAPSQSMSSAAASPTFSPPFSTNPAGKRGDYDPSAELMQRAMPVVNAFLRTSQTAVSQEKVHLLNAIKPFVADGVSGHLDRAMRLVSMARMARTAMQQIGTSSPDNPDDGTREV